MSSSPLEEWMAEHRRLRDRRRRQHQAIRLIALLFLVLFAALILAFWRLG